MKKSIQKSILLLLLPLLCLVQWQSFAEKSNKVLLPTVTLTTEAVPAGNLAQTNTGDIYIVKVLSTEDFTLNSISFKTSGTFVAGDLNLQFLHVGSTNVSSASTSVSGAFATSVASGNTITFGGLTQNIVANTARYFFLRVSASTTATIGNTIKVNGADTPNPVTLGSTSSTLTIVNNQTNIAGLQTFTAPALVLTTEAIPAFNAAQGSTNQAVCILKMQSQFPSNQSVTQVSVKLDGTFLAGDLSSVSVATGPAPNTSVQYSPVSQAATTVTNGNTLTINASWIFAPNSVLYLLVMVNPSSSAVVGRTVKVNNPVVLTTTMPITNNQTNITGDMTIVSPVVTLTTEPLPASNITPNTSGTIYVQKLFSTSGAVLRGVNIPIQGTFTNADINFWDIFIGNSPSDLSGTSLGGPYTFTGGVLSNSPSGLGFYNLPSNTNKYLILRSYIKATAVIGNTIKVNGATSPPTIIANAGTVITNNQTDVAGTQTIQGPLVTITTEPKAAATVLPNSSTEIYNFKALSDKATKIDQLSFKIEGTFTPGKIVEIYVYENTTNTVTGSPILTLSTLTKTAGDVFTFALGSSYGFLAANTAKYYKFIAKMAPTLPDGYDVKVNGTTNMLAFTVGSTYPPTTFINSQTDIFGTQTVLAPLPTGSVQSSFISTVTTTEKTAYATNYLGIIATLKANPQISSSVLCTVWPTGGTTLNYVARHYEMSVNVAAIAPTATITLYFSQAEFDAYNLLPALDLPTSSTDATGKANLRIKKYATISTGNNGVAYTGSPVDIDPDDAKIIFQNGRWEVTFDASNFGGLFLGTVPPPCPGTGVSPSSAILTCTNPTASITATGGGTYSWTGPSGFTSTTATITASVAGNYIVTAVTTNNCTAISTVVVTTNQTTPTVTITPTSSVLTCTTPTASITAAGGSTYVWAGPSGFTSATASISASTAGSYIVTVTGANGCTSTASVSVTNNNTPPPVSVSPTSAILICGSPTASITASGGSTYAWTGPSGFTSTTAMITANAGGNYVVKATGANGCTATTSIMVTNNIAPVAPTISPSGTTTLCPPATSLTLTASGCVGGTITWNTSPTPTTGTSIIVTQAGSFSATCATACGTSSASATTVVSTVCICLLNTTLGSGTWSTANNWSCGHIPLATEPVQIPTGQTITLDVNGAAKSLDLRGVLNKQATKVLLIQGN
jgi:hypothetical protein